MDDGVDIVSFNLNAAGFTDYLTKPVNIEEMENMLIKYLPAGKVSLTEGGDPPAESPLAGLPSGIFDIPGLDPSVGAKSCGDAEAYMSALTIFQKSIEAKAKAIEENAGKGDLDAYTIAVHSLKSTSHSIGAASTDDPASQALLRRPVAILNIPKDIGNTA